MALSAGDRLGPYEILAPVGSGGMGEVYRASDTRLDRVVAVKVLPSALSGNPMMRQRLEREARVIAKLSHPHICTLYDVGSEGATDFLVMEYLEGESLADRLTRGRLPMEKVLQYASEMADGLHHAHRHGVIHRDLKPGNVLLTKPGAKLLDFGLAKLHELEPLGEPLDKSSVPTFNQPLTEEGMILGSYPYMAPEQLEGKPTDGRADMFALGAILYEMLTGQRPFQGESRASLIAAIMTSEPRPMADLEPVVPPSLDRIVKRCLQKDPNDRWESAGDLAAELRWILGDGPKRELTGERPGRGKWKTPFALALAGVGLVATGVLIGLGTPRSQRMNPGEMARSARQVTTQQGVEWQPALAPDGGLVAYVSGAAGNDDIYIQRVTGQNALNLTADSPDDDQEPAFSPDGNKIAFRSEREGGGIFVMGATGESVRRLTSGLEHNPSWSPDGRRLVAATEGVFDPLARTSTSELWVIDAQTGESRRLYSGDAVQPAWSPDGRRIAFWRVDGNSGQRDLATIDAERGGDPVAITTDVFLDWNPVWSPDGGSLFFLSDRLGTVNVWRIPIDSLTGAAVGEPTFGGAPTEAAGWLSAARAEGTLAYSTSSAMSFLYSLELDADSPHPLGQPHLLYGGTLPIRDAAASPKGDSVTLTTGGQREDLYVLEDQGKELRRLTDDPYRDRGPAWSPDGSEIAFYSNRTGTYQVWSVRPDGSGLRQLTSIPQGAWNPSWSPDGGRIAFPNGVASCVVTVEESPVSKAECLPRPSEEEWFYLYDWSPDGEWLVGGRSYLMGFLPEPKLLLWSFETTSYKEVDQRSSRARWMPDSSHVALLNEESHLVLIDRTSGQPRDLGTPELNGIVDRSRLAVSRDGQRLLFVSRSVEADIWLLSSPTTNSGSPEID